MGVSANVVKNKQVNLSWSALADNKVTYAIYRSYLEPNGTLSREMKKIADGVKTNNYLDHLPDNGAASYQVFANNSVGESQPSVEVFVGVHQKFKAGDRIQAEFYQQKRNTSVLHSEQQQSVLFSSNEGHYPPGLTPFSPAWLTYSFDSEQSKSAKLKMNVRGAKGAIIEVWQGRHLVAKMVLEGAKDFVEKTVTAELIKGNEPIQIRQANKQYFVLDWFELSFL